MTAATVKESERRQLLEDELLIVRHSGEIPEIAYHGTLYFLCQDPEGPQLELNDRELQSLQAAALARYLEIILRDLDPANRDLPLYRGLARAIVNHQRMTLFSQRLGRLGDPSQDEVRRALLDFLAGELADVQSGKRRPSLNCRPRDLAVFARDLGIGIGDMPKQWHTLFPGGE